MTSSSLVTINNTIQSNGTLIALIGAQIRGKQNTPSIPPFGPCTDTAIFHITIYSDNEDPDPTISFRLQQQNVMIPLIQTMTFVNDGNVGTVTTPFQLSDA